MHQLLCNLIFATHFGQKSKRIPKGQFYSVELRDSVERDLKEHCPTYWLWMLIKNFQYYADTEMNSGKLIRSWWYKFYAGSDFTVDSTGKLMYAHLTKNQFDRPNIGICACEVVNECL